MGSKSNPPQFRPVASFSHIKSYDFAEQVTECEDRLSKLRHSGASESEIEEAKDDLATALRELRYQS